MCNSILRHLLKPMVGFRLKATAMLYNSLERAEIYQQNNLISGEIISGLPAAQPHSLYRTNVCFKESPSLYYSNEISIHGWKHFIE